MINQTLNKLHSMNLKAMEEEYRRQLELSISNSLSFDERLAMMVMPSGWPKLTAVSKGY